VIGNRLFITVMTEMRDVVLAKVQAAALAYAWCKVCFTAWDETLEAAGERVLGYSKWPILLRALLHAIYPAYFVYSGAAKLSGPDSPMTTALRSRFLALLSVACALAAMQGARAGRAARMLQ
jgi:hypothetical protein